MDELLARMDSAWEALVRRAENDAQLWAALEAPPFNPSALGGGNAGSDSNATTGGGGHRRIPSSP